MKRWLGACALLTGTFAIHAVAEPTLHELNAGQLTGRDAYTRAGRSIGEVLQVLRDKEQSTPCVLIRVEGFLGLGGVDLAVPIRDLRLHDGDLFLTRAVRDEKLRNKYAYDEKEYETLPKTTPLSSVIRNDQPSGGATFERIDGENADGTFGRPPLQAGERSD